MEHLDQIKKPASIVQPSSFVDLLDNLSANDSFDSKNYNRLDGKPLVVVQDFKSDIDFTIVRDGRAASIFEHEKEAAAQ
jgi:hypothetical protein